jgi:hypothetical protein
MKESPWKIRAFLAFQKGKVRLASNVVQVLPSGQTNTFSKTDFQDLTKSVSDAYRDTRTATIEFPKTVIINVLLPILTALLGYLFGSKEKSDPNSGSSS